MNNNKLILIIIIIIGSDVNTTPMPLSLTETAVEDVNSYHHSIVTDLHAASYCFLFTGSFVMLNVTHQSKTNKHKGQWKKKGVICSLYTVAA